MFENIYKIHIASIDKITSYQEAWRLIATYRVESCGAISSYLYLNPSDPQECLIHWRWPNVEMYKKHFSSTAVPRIINESKERMDEIAQSSMPIRISRRQIANYVRDQNYQLKEKIETERKNILIYNDKGCSDSVCQVMAMLEGVVDRSRCRIFFVNSNYINNYKDWEKDTALFVMPGGYARPHYITLGAKWENDSVNKGEKRIIAKTGLGNERIRRFVENGGHYLGICAGAYYGAALTIFEEDGPLEVIDEGALNFFPGVAEGPAYGLGKFRYASEKGAEVAQISSSQLLHVNNLSVYYNGGCAFRGLESSRKIPEDSILAYYSNLTSVAGEQTTPAVAIVENQIGKGSAILSGVHFECLSTDFSHGMLRASLSEGDKERQLLQAEIMGRLGIPLAINYYEKIYGESSTNMLSRYAGQHQNEIFFKSTKEASVNDHKEETMQLRL